MHEAHDDVRREVTVERDGEAVFQSFTRVLGAWWPAAYTFSGEVFAAAEVEPREGGRWYERDRSGTELAWGEVRPWEPPLRRVLSWRGAADRTRVVLTHRAFAWHGDGAETMRTGMASPQGWRFLLERFLDHVEDASP
jgi:hypothetical protein